MQEFQVSIYPARNQTFLISFVHPLTKRKVRESFSSREDAYRFKKTVETKFLSRNKKAYSEMTLEELLVLFLKEKPKNPFSRKVGHLIDFIETFGDFKINDLTTDALKVWMDQVQRENNLKDISMRGLKCDIDTLFAFLETKEIISESPLKEIYYEKTVPPVKARNILTPEEIQKLLLALKNHSPGYLYPIIKMYAETGAKVMEVLELKWTELNLQSGVVYFKGHEKCQPRKLVISDELVKLLNKRKRTSKLVFQTYYNESFTRAKLSRAVNEFKKLRTFSSQWTPSDLRHSYAVNFLRNGGDLKELQRILGHNNVYDTKRLYGEIVSKVTENGVLDIQHP